jgi:hypothetical protein
MRMLRINNKKMDAKEFDSLLEDMIDETSLVEVISTMSSICFGKAEHIRSNWQDENLAKLWDRAAKVLDTLSNHKTLEALL